jgi:C-terminal processing protease CtpA/Prc
MKTGHILTLLLSFLAANILTEEGPGSISAQTETQAQGSQEFNVEKTEDSEGEIKIVVKAQDGRIDERSVFRKTIIDKIDEIVIDIETYLPRISEDIKDIEIASGIRSMLKNFNSEIEYLPEGIKTPPPPAEPEFHKPIIIANHKILYIRIDGFSFANFAKFKEECENVSRLANRPSGIIIDLRNASGTEGKIAAEYASLFFDDGIISFAKNTEKALLKDPLIILTGGKTSGDGEIMSAILMRRKGTMIIGEKSAGVPFRKIAVDLKTGGALLIPEIPDELRFVQTKPVEPSILVTPYPQIEYSIAAEKSGSEKSDQCLLKSIDLLICLEAIHSAKDNKK